jgi:hypothetical protein
MKFKKRILISSIALATIANANQFKIIIDGEDVSYIAEKPISSDITYTAWTSQGETNCNYTPLDSSVYSGESFNQDKTCDLTETRVATTTTTYQSGKVVVEDKTETRTTPYTEQISSTGTHLEANCKDIKAFDNSLIVNKFYPVIGGSTLNCEMVTDGGGWTEVAHVSGTFSVTAPTVTVDDKGIAHTQMLYVDNNSVSDLSYGDSNWIWQGMDKEKNLIKTGGQWRKISGGRGDTCLNVSNTIPANNYTTIEQNVTTCLWGSSNDPSMCGRKIKVDIPSGQKFEGFGDIESIYQSCNANNHFVLDYKLYIR